MKVSTACANPSCSFDAVTCRATAWTSGLGIAHRDAHPRHGQHRHVVRHVADRRDLVQRDLQDARRFAHHHPLVRLGVRDVEEVRLRPRGGGAGAKARGQLTFAALDQRQIVADADQLDRLVEHGGQVADRDRLKSHVLTLAGDVRRLHAAHEPIPALVHPDVQPGAQQIVDGVSRDVRCDRPLRQHRLQIGLHVDAAVERRHARSSGSAASPALPARAAGGRWSARTSRRPRAAAPARPARAGVSSLARVTSVPSTSAISSLIFIGSSRADLHIAAAAAAAPTRPTCGCVTTNAGKRSTSVCRRPLLSNASRKTPF